jgi:enamine deaminase RidA (YjgF/YER057c/UK114 family)
VSGDRRQTGGGAGPACSASKERAEPKVPPSLGKPAAAADKRSGTGRKIGLYLLIGLGLNPGYAAAAFQARTEGTVLMAQDPEARAFQDRYGYSDAVIAGDLVFLSGVVVAQRPGEELEAAFERAYRTIGALEDRAGSGWDDVVDMTSYHTDVAAQFEAMAAAHKRFVSAPYPAWTAIDVDRLIPERGIAEIKVVARRSAVRPAN